MFISPIILYARSFWVTECTPNPSQSFQHWLAPMTQSTMADTVSQVWYRAILIHAIGHK